MNENITLPQPDQITRKERDDAMGAYFMMFAAWGIGLPFPFLNLIAAVIYYVLNRKESRFVAFHAHQSLTSQTPVTVANGSLLFFTIRNMVRDFQFPAQYWWWLAFVTLLNIAYIVISLVALARAYRGNFFYIPFFGRWAFNRWYGPNAASVDPVVRPNLPPG
jgi:uncharacterized membrane protein